MESLPSRRSSKTRTIGLLIMESDIEVIHLARIVNDDSNSLPRLPTTGAYNEYLYDETFSVSCPDPNHNKDIHLICYWQDLKNQSTLSRHFQKWRDRLEPIRTQPYRTSYMHRAKKSPRLYQTPCWTANFHFRYDKNRVLVRQNLLDWATQKQVQPSLRATVLYFAYHLPLATQLNNHRKYDSHQKRFYWPIMATGVYDIVWSSWDCLWMWTRFRRNCNRERFVRLDPCNSSQSISLDGSHRLNFAVNLWW